MDEGQRAESRQDGQRGEGRTKVLLSEGSSTSARETLYGLGRSCLVDIVDPSPWCQCRFSSFVRRWHRCPKLAKDPLGYLTFVADLLRRRRYDVLFPAHEQVYLFAKYRDVLGRYVGLAVPEFDALRRLQSKADFARLMDELGLPGPETHVARSEREVETVARFPCYLKLAHGTASLSVKLVHGRDDLREALEHFKSENAWEEGAEIVIQQPAHGSQAVVNAVFQDGRLLGAHCVELLATGIGGGPTLRVGVSHPVVVDHVRRLGAYLNWNGALFLDYFYDGTTGRPQYIEANPRIGETANALLSGVNLCELVVQVSLGGRVEAVGPGKIGIKSHTGFIILLADAYNGANRRQLIRRLCETWAGKGIFGSGLNEMMRLREDWGSAIPAAATTLGVLFSPQSARRLSKNTVDNYSLPQSAVTVIDRLPADALDASPGDWKQS
jgi:hypothetical protein